MALEIVRGESRDRTTANALADLLNAHLDSGTLYLGYPVLATADDRVNVDALLVTVSHGLTAFLLGDGVPQSEEEFERIVEEQDQLYTVLESHLGRHGSLRRGRTLATKPNTATVFAAPIPSSLSKTRQDGFYGDLSELSAWLDRLPSIETEVERSLQAALQRVTTIKPAKKRTTVKGSETRGAVLKYIEKGIANLDRWQKAAAIESPEGPQRIRGLAGSGKTVVLALKAAYLHAQHPEWNIALTFHSRSLYQQILDLVTRFTFEHSNDQPNDEKLKIVHSWGSNNRAGIYSMIANSLGEVTRDWNYARGKYGMDGAFKGVCQELLEVACRRTIEPIFDAFLIDEAQDLPPEFFRLVYLFTKDPKRIVWGYDELQKLSESAMPTTDELFGLGSHGERLITLETGADEARRDIVLPVCYRNTPWALTTAHALGTGVYRESEGLIQHPDDPTLWKDIGYNNMAGELVAGSQVKLKRSGNSYPTYFDECLNASDAVIFREFNSEDEQDAWIAAEIEKNLSVDELDHDDILIVLPDSYRAKSRGPRLMSHLRSRGIDSHLVGVTTSVDAVFRADSIALAHIFRAKGNEAPMVYAIDSQTANSTFNLLTARNTLFTAITRSRAWVRITGYGNNIGPIANEINKVIDNEYCLKFRIPTPSELEQLRHIYRERSEQDVKAIKRASEGIRTFLEAMERGDLELTDLPPDVRTKLITSLRSAEYKDDDH